MRIMLVFALLFCMVVAGTGADPIGPGMNRPLAIPFRISGSFGEYRPASRYHHGIDIKTYEQNGIPVYAPLDGYVSRIHTSEYGYGNGLFVRSGEYEFTFGHLNDFRGVRPDLELYRLSLRILQPDHIAAVVVPPWFSFNKGDQIARTGESGLGSPHLHFEIRHNGTYFNPLAFKGIAIKDTTQPEIIDVIVETLDARYQIPARKEGSGYVLASSLPLQKQRLLIGCFDTQSALNRNGVETLKYEFNGKSIYERNVDSIKPEDLIAADRLYHAGLTVIGKVYYYYLYDMTSANGYMAEAGKGSVTLGDISGNQVQLHFNVAGDASIEAYKMQGNAPLTWAMRGASSRATSGSASISIGFVGSGSGGVAVAKIPDGSLKPGLTQAGPAFYVTQRDMILAESMRLNYSLQPTNASLYLIHPITKTVSLLGAGQLLGGRTVYDIMFRSEGWVVPLYDAIPPRVERVLLFGDLRGDARRDRDPDTGEWFREYYFSDSASGIRPDTIQILFNGSPVPFVWKGDRSVAAVSIPDSLIPSEGAILSLRAADMQGNRSDWMLDAIVK
ncbi:MAG: M23 family metallopeptidase [Spirochaetia bacterium]|nr:M23 family metallopeptidase [Spirochaetia bacterium]